MKNEIIKLIEKQINPVLKNHNGSCKLVSFKNKTACIQLLGGCDGCPGKKNTFLKGIKPYLISNLPELKDVILSE